MTLMVLKTSSPTNVILDSLDAVRQYLETPTSCKCGLQCPLIVDKVFNFDSMIKSKSWEVTQVLEGTHCRQKSNILEMATLTNCIDSFCDTDQKSGNWICFALQFDPMRAFKYSKTSKTNSC